MTDTLVAIEWPRQCKYWKHEKVRHYLKTYDGIYSVILDGCAFGLVDPRTGEPIKKPWRIDTDVPEFWTKLSKT